MRSKTINGTRTCSLCETRFPATIKHFYRHCAGGLSSECRACFRLRSSANQRTRHHAGGVAYHLGYIIRSARFRARTHGLAFDIDPDFLTTLLQAQQGLCALSGVVLTFAKGKGHVPTNASIDRINPELGYTRGNIQLVAFQVNTMKSNLARSELARWCRLVLAGRATRRSATSAAVQD